MFTSTDAFRGIFRRQGFLPRTLLPVLALLGALTVLLSGCNALNNLTGSGATGTPTATAVPYYKVGDKVNVNDVYLVTVNSFKTNPGADIAQPKSGDVFVAVNLTLTNISDLEQNYTSLLQCRLQDGTGQKYIQTIISTTTLPDGKIEPGDSVTGDVAYEVPADQHDFVFFFQSDVISGGQALWHLHA